MKILCDIGGTYVRFAFHEGAEPQHVQKFKVSEHRDFATALNHFLEDASIPLSPILMSTAGYSDSGVWKFVNENPWEIDPEALKTKGISFELILNDFEATCWGVQSLEEGDLEVLRTGKTGEVTTRAVMGPGTGLGLGYLIETGQGTHIHKTHGGHMPLACATEDQWFIAQLIKRLYKEFDVLVFENLASGPGLMRIYKAACSAHGKLEACKSVEAMLENPKDLCVRDTLTIFHEFLGLCAANAIITGHAYGGLYLTGGVLDRLFERGLFDAHNFFSMFLLHGVDSVRTALENTPVYKIKDPYLSFKGLIEAQNA